MKVIVSTTNTHRDEQEELKNYLDGNCWENTQLTPDECKTIRDIIDHLVIKETVTQVTDMNYIQILALKRKFNI